MKKLLIIFMLLSPFKAYSLDLLESCPTGYTTVYERDLYLLTSYQSGYYQLESTMPGCNIASPASTCYLYAPANSSFTTPKGNLTFSTMCPWTE